MPLQIRQSLGVMQLDKMEEQERDKIRMTKLAEGDIKNEWEAYILDKNEFHFSASKEKLNFKIPAKYKYPALHRICDIKIGSDYFRISRLVFHKEYIFFNSCDTPNLEENGVPYWLNGQKLRNWIKDQKEMLAEGIDIYNLELTDWEKYR